MIYADEELLEQENELNTVAMEIILHAGHAKTLADEAFQLQSCSRSFNDNNVRGSDNKETD